MAVAPFSGRQPGATARNCHSDRRGPKGNARDLLFRAFSGPFGGTEIDCNLSSSPMAISYFRGKQLSGHCVRQGGSDWTMPIRPGPRRCRVSSVGDFPCSLPIRLGSLSDDVSLNEHSWASRLSLILKPSSMIVMVLGLSALLLRLHLVFACSGT